MQEKSHMKYKFEHICFKEWLFTELSKSLSYEIAQWHKDNPDLPFDNLFPEGATRVVIPFAGEDPVASSIVNKIKQQGLEIKGNVLTDGKRSIRIGKYILGPTSNFTKEQKDWWIGRGDPVEDLKAAKEPSQYAILVSRNPIDVIRMSDHSWSSCHSPGGPYFKCAVAESKEGGLVAYVVRRDDLNHVDLSKPEIFTDNERKVKGIEPLQRIRLRHFVNKKEGYDLAVPETRIYGKRIPGVEESLRDWSHEKQQNVLKGRRPSLKDFKLVGGSYEDTSGSELFNTFFQDEKDVGSSQYGGGQESQSQYEIWEEEVEEIKEEFKNKFTICDFYVDIEFTEQQPYVYFSGHIFLPLPEGIEIEINSKLKSKIREWASNHWIYNVEDISEDNNRLILHINPDEQGNPDEFRSFLQMLENDVENKKQELINSLNRFLMDEGLIDKNKVHEKASELQENSELQEFHNFKWELWDKEHYLSLDIKNPIMLPFPNELSQLNWQNKETTLKIPFEIWKSVMDDAFWVNEVHQFQNRIINLINSYAENIAKQQLRQKSLFPNAIHIKKPYNPALSLKPTITLKMDSHNRAICDISLNFYFTHKDEEFDQAIEFIRFLDNNFDKLTKIVQQVYTDTVLKDFKKQLTFRS
jgi:hypothetical protein